MTINAKDFGAKADGKTDDTAAVQAWLDAGGKPELPPGVYRLSGALRINRG